METNDRSRSDETVNVRRSMNDHGTMTVEVVSNNQTRHLVEYENRELKETLAALPEGTTIPVAMRPIGARANVWRATGLGARRKAASSTVLTASD